MLRGWRLLATSCPICNTALLSNRSGEMICPGCNVPVKDERSISVQFPSGKETRTVDCDDVNLDNELFNYSSTAHRLNDISGKLGGKLLKGWIMRAESCPEVACRGTPLMQENGDKPMICVCCNAEYIYRDGKLASFQKSPSVVGSLELNDDVSKHPETSASEIENRMENLPEGSIQNCWAFARKVLGDVSGSYYVVARIFTMIISSQKLIASCRELEKTENIEICMDLTTLVIKLSEGLKAVGSSPY